MTQPSIAVIRGTRTVAGKKFFLAPRSGNTPSSESAIYYGFLADLLAKEYRESGPSKDIEREDSSHFIKEYRKRISPVKRSGRYSCQAEKEACTWEEFNGGDVYWEHTEDLWQQYDKVAIPFVPHSQPVSKMINTLTIDDLSEIIKKWMKEMQRMHGLGIINFDIKPDNLLVQRNVDGEKFKVTICDFGRSKRVRKEGMMDDVIEDVGTFYFKAPELEACLSEQKYGYKLASVIDQVVGPEHQIIDYFSLGRSILYLCNKFAKNLKKANMVLSETEQQKFTQLKRVGIWLSQILPDKRIDISKGLAILNSGPGSSEELEILAKLGEDSQVCSQDEELIEEEERTKSSEESFLGQGILAKLNAGGNVSSPVPVSPLISSAPKLTLAPVPASAQTFLPPAEEDSWLKRREITKEFNDKTEAVKEHIVPRVEPDIFNARYNALVEILERRGVTEQMVPKKQEQVDVLETHATTADSKDESAVHEVKMSTN